MNHYSSPDPMTAVLATFRDPEATGFESAWVGMEPTFQSRKLITMLRLANNPLNRLPIRQSLTLRRTLSVAPKFMLQKIFHHQKTRYGAESAITTPRFEWGMCRESFGLT